jgi:mRNA-degrading endonuclease RelE of RelBE toxin-antitoxin system
MDKIKKALNKLKTKERADIKELLVKINNKDFQGLDLKKIKGRNDIFRIRKASLRIIFYKTKSQIKVLSVERRKSKTYSKRQND